MDFRSADPSSDIHPRSLSPLFDEIHWAIVARFEESLQDLLVEMPLRVSDKVRRFPPGSISFDSPSDPRDYSWRTTWFAEHKDESTLAFYATLFGDEMVGPGIGLSRYGGAMFLYPPVMIPDIWTDPRLDYTETLEERLIAAACMHAGGRQVALLSALPPGGGWRKLARRHKKTLVHVPLSSFSDEQVQQLRMVHVLNGREVRSYAEEFIRRV